jgi:hypothetical protein
MENKFHPEKWNTAIINIAGKINNPAVTALPRDLIATCIMLLKIRFMIEVCIILIGFYRTEALRCQIIIKILPHDSPAISGEGQDAMKHKAIMICRRTYCFIAISDSQ